MFEDLEVVEDDDHAYMDFFVGIAEEKHEVYLDVLDRVTESRDELGLVL